MSRQEAQALLEGYGDGALDGVSSVEVERHLRACQACAHTEKNHDALRSAIRGGEPYCRPPAALHKRVRAAVRQANRAEIHTRPWPWRGLRVAASLAAVAVLVWRLGPVLTGPSADHLLTRELMAGQVRSRMAAPLTAVASSDQHTVKPWFEGKLAVAPPVSDLTAQGFPLVGGRLDYLDNKPAAALVYRRQQHVINLFIWPATAGASAGEKTLTQQGDHLIDWAQAGVRYWAVSNLNVGELQAFVRGVQQATQPQPGASTSRRRDSTGASRS